MKIILQSVRFIPKELKPGVLYVSEEFGTAAHLCASGCGLKVRTPIGPSEWSLEVTDSGPSLRPSIGNWQFPCQSHYWITRGEIVWANKWTIEEINAGRQYEIVQRRTYFDSINQQKNNIVIRFWNWVRRMLVP